MSEPHYSGQNAYEKPCDPDFVGHTVTNPGADPPDVIPSGNVEQASGNSGIHRGKSVVRVDGFAASGGDEHRPRRVGPIPVEVNLSADVCSVVVRGCDAHFIPPPA